VDGIDGRVHYAQLGRLPPAELPGRGAIVSLGADSLQGKPKSMPRLHVLSPVEIASQIDYEGPTWLDRALIARERLSTSTVGFGAELNQALSDRGRWLAQQNLADTGAEGAVRPKPETPDLLRQREIARLVQRLSRQLNAMHVPQMLGDRVSGVYDHAIATPTGKVAVIRNQDTFSLAPWKPALEPMRGQSVTGLVQQHRVTWALERGRTLPRRS
jgi:hypothetical protein